MGLAYIPDINPNIVIRKWNEQIDLTLGTYCDLQIKVETFHAKHMSQMWGNEDNMFIRQKNM